MKEGGAPLALVAMLGAAGMLALFVTGEAVAMFGAALALAALYAVTRLPVRTTLLLVAFLALALDNPHERPGAGIWKGPFAPLGQLFYEGLHHTVPFPVLRFSGLEAVLGLLCLLIAWRRATGRNLDGPSPQMPTPLSCALSISAVALAVLELWGLSRGGDLQQSAFQFRKLFAVPVAAYLFQHALRGEQDIRALGRVVVGASLVKSVEAAYVYYVLCVPKGILPPYVTTHSDTVLFALAIVIVVARWWEQPSGSNLARVLLVSPVVTLGVVLNDRRLAYVTLAACLLAIFLLSPWKGAKRFVARAAIMGMPLVVAYFAVGWTSASAVFAPVRTLRSVLVTDTGSEEDASTEFRDLENFNLVQTWMKAPLVGTGFGHQYDEVIRLPDISRLMPTYRFQPHNGVLWLWTIGGVIGFTAVWLYLGVAAFFAARAYHRAASPDARAAMLASISAVIAYANQAFGDMGTQSYTSVFTIAPAVVLAGKVAMLVGAWNEGRVRERMPPLTLVPAPDAATGDLH